MIGWLCSVRLCVHVRSHLASICWTDRPQCMGSAYSILEVILMEDLFFGAFLVEIGDRWKDVAGREAAPLTKE